MEGAGWRGELLAGILVTLKQRLPLGVACCCAGCTVPTSCFLWEACLFFPEASVFGGVDSRLLAAEIVARVHPHVWGALLLTAKLLDNDRQGCLVTSLPDVAD